MTFKHFPKFISIYFIFKNKIKKLFIFTLLTQNSSLAKVVINNYYDEEIKWIPLYFLFIIHFTWHLHFSLLSKRQCSLLHFLMTTVMSLWYSSANLCREHLRLIALIFSNSLSNCLIFHFRKYILNSININFFSVSNPSKPFLHEKVKEKKTRIIRMNNAKAVCYDNKSVSLIISFDDWRYFKYKLLLPLPENGYCWTN